MAYEVRLSAAARKFLDKLDEDLRGRIWVKVLALGDEPRPAGCKKLKGPQDLYRIRVGDYRILYQIHDQQLIVYVVRVGHRREVYD